MGKKMRTRPSEWSSDSYWYSIASLIDSAAPPLEAGHTAHTLLPYIHTPPCRFPHTCKQMGSLTKQRSGRGIHIQSISSLDTQPVDHYAKYALWQAWTLNNNDTLSTVVPCKVQIFTLRSKNAAPGFSFVVGEIKVIVVVAQSVKLHQTVRV